MTAGYVYIVINAIV